MRLTMMTDYAMRLLMHVAQHPERLCTIVEVARVYGISEAHLMKVTHQLALDGWIETVRGKGGGMRLAFPPAEIRVGDVVRSVESEFRLTECFGEDNRCVLTGHCRLATLLDTALKRFFDELDSQTLADLLPASAGIRPKANAGGTARRAEPAPVREQVMVRMPSGRGPRRRTDPGTLE